MDPGVQLPESVNHVPVHPVSYVSSLYTAAKEVTAAPHRGELIDREENKNSSKKRLNIKRFKKPQTRAPAAIHKMQGK